MNLKQHMEWPNMFCSEMAKLSHLQVCQVCFKCRIGRAKCYWHDQLPLLLLLNVKFFEESWQKKSMRQEFITFHLKVRQCQTTS